MCVWVCVLYCTYYLIIGMTQIKQALNNAK